MIYQLLICASARELIALDVDDAGRLDRISLEGNESMEITGKGVISCFCGLIREYYSIESFNDVEIKACIVSVDAEKACLDALAEELRDAVQLNIVDAKSLFPMLALKQKPLRAGSMVRIDCMGGSWLMRIGEDLCARYVDGVADDGIVIEPEMFSQLYLFDCRGLISNEEEQKKAAAEHRARLAEKDAAYRKLMAEYQKLAMNNVRVYMLDVLDRIRSRREEDELAAKRTVIRFEEEKPAPKSGSGLFRSDIFYAISAGFPDELKTSKYELKTSKLDGSIVEEGHQVAKVLYSGIALQNENYKYKAPFCGRVYFPKGSGEEVKDGDVLAIVTDVRDSREKVMEWYRRMYLLEK